MSEQGASGGTRRWSRAAARATGPLEPLAARAAAVSAGILTVLALGGALVRVLPWLLDPRVPWRMALPFGRAVASVALEAAVLVGWPVGWALAAFVLVERGEARVLAMLGERPLRTTARLVPMALVFSALLAGASLAGGRDASEPGRVLADLLRAGRASCGAASGVSSSDEARGANATGPANPTNAIATGVPRAVDVPLLGAAWLCRSAGDARLVGHPPRGEAALYSARAVDVSPDARRVELDDAFLVGANASLHVGHALFRLPLRPRVVPARPVAGGLSRRGGGCVGAPRRVAPSRDGAARAHVVALPRAPRRRGWARLGARAPPRARAAGDADAGSPLCGRPARRRGRDRLRRPRGDASAPLAGPAHGCYEIS